MARSPGNYVRDLNNSFQIRHLARLSRQGLGGRYRESVAAGFRRVRRQPRTGFRSSAETSPLFIVAGIAIKVFAVSEQPNSFPRLERTRENEIVVKRQMQKSPQRGVINISDNLRAWWAKPQNFKPITLLIGKKWLAVLGETAQAANALLSGERPAEHVGSYHFALHRKREAHRRRDGQAPRQWFFASTGCCDTEGCKTRKLFRASRKLSRLLAESATSRRCRYSRRGPTAGTKIVVRLAWNTLIVMGSKNRTTEAGDAF